MQEIYKEPVKAELITQRVKEIKDGGVLAAASLTPQNVERYIEAALDGGLDILIIQGTVVSAEHVSSYDKPLDLNAFIRDLDIPVIVGGCCSYSGRAAPHAHRRRRRARGRRPGPRVHVAPRARHRRPAGHRDRGRRRGPHAPPRRDRHATATSSPTAACAPAATSPRRSPCGADADHDRLAARVAPPRRPAAATTGAWRPSTPTCRAAPACSAGVKGTLEEILLGPAHRERRHAEPVRRPAHVDGDVRLREPQDVPEGRGHGRAVAADRGQGPAERAGRRDGPLA